MRNTGDLALSGITVTLLVDGLRVQNVTLDSRAPGQARTVLLNFTLPAGRHNVSLAVDPDGALDLPDRSQMTAGVTVSVTAASPPPKPFLPGAGAAASAEALAAAAVAYARRARRLR